ncbi:MAG: hypothetical protein EGR50_06160 [Alistipes communis]|nr:hypothetical protein [Alistipes communis]HCP59322.1 hypothetical protein [Alistipes communis]
MHGEGKPYHIKRIKIMKDEQTTCTPCEQNFEDNINELVDQVEDYTRKDRMRKEREVEEAFAADKEPKR